MKSEVPNQENGHRPGKQTARRVISRAVSLGIPIMKKYIFPVFKPAPDDSTCIYHYTNIRGAIGILSEKKVRMTNIGYLNDWMEGRYFYVPLLEMISNIHPKLHKIYEKIFKNTYIASFSRKPDLLSQYKYYGNTCIAFEILGIHESISKLNNYEKSGFEVNTDINYKSNEEFEEILCKFAENNDLIQKVMDEDVKSILEFFCFFGVIKHHGFFEENESRICHIWHEPKEVKYRLNKNRRIPYIELQLLPKAIKKIIIGPQHIQKEIAFDLENLKNQDEELEHIDICCSGIPFIP